MAKSAKKKSRNRKVQGAKGPSQSSSKVRSKSKRRVRMTRSQGSLPQVEHLSGVYLLPGITTPGGYPVFSRSQKLIEGIRAEGVERGAVTAEEFGLFSAYCTFRDYIEGRTFMTEQLVDELFRSDHVLIAAECVCPWSAARSELLPKVQHAFSRSSISLGVSVREDAQSLKKFLDRLRPEEQTALCLLNGMWGVPVSVFVLLSLGVIDFKYIRSRIEEPLQVDDWESYGLVSGVSYVEDFLNCF